MNFTKIFEPLMKYVGEQNTTFRSAFAAFILATVISAVLFAILHLSVDHQGQPFIRDDGDFRVTLAIVFVALFTTFFIVMTIVSRREADDLLTPYRKQIEGVYNVLFTINEVDRSSGAIKRVGRQATCVIRINVAGKLNLQFDVINSDLFFDHTYQVEHVFLA